MQLRSTRVGIRRRLAGGRLARGDDEADVAIEGVATNGRFDLVAERAGGDADWPPRGQTREALARTWVEDFTRSEQPIEDAGLLGDERRNLTLGRECR